MRSLTSVSPHSCSSGREPARRLDHELAPPSLPTRSPSQQSQLQRLTRRNPSPSSTPRRLFHPIRNANARRSPPSSHLPHRSLTPSKVLLQLPPASPTWTKASLRPSRWRKAAPRSPRKFDSSTHDLVQAIPRESPPTLQHLNPFSLNPTRPSRCLLPTSSLLTLLLLPPRRLDPLSSRLRTLSTTLQPLDEPTLEVLLYPRPPRPNSTPPAAAGPAAATTLPTRPSLPSYPPSRILRPLSPVPPHRVQRLRRRFQDRSGSCRAGRVRIKLWSRAR
jgi:hypothetical protein